MLEALNTNIAEYIKLSPEEQKARGILGRLCGIIADYKNPTRNGRLYSEDLWDNVFNSDLMQEKINTKTLFGELGHPLDGRTETDMEKIAICLSETPKKGKDGCLYGIFDILDTPNGKILKALCDYGTTIGVSSRGEGDLITDRDGQEAVDPDTYSCECWDAVLTPSVATARMKYESFNESLEPSKRTLVESLKSVVNNATNEDKQIMTETLNNLGISLTEGTTAEDVDYEELRKEAKSLLKDTYGNITNNKTLEAALKQAVDEHNNEDIMTIAKLLKKYDPDFVKDHTKVNDLAERPVKDTSMDDFSMPEEPIDTLDSPDMPEPMIDEQSDLSMDGTENMDDFEEPIDEPSVKESLDNNKNIVYNNIEENFKWSNEELIKVAESLKKYGFTNYNDFCESLDKLNSQQQQNNAADDLIDEDVNNTEVDNNKTDMINALQEALLSKQTIEAETLKLNEKLSVCYAKEAKQEVEINQLKESLKKVEHTKSIVENLKEKSSNQTNLLNEANGQIRNLNDKCKDIVNKYNTLAENYNNKQKELKELNESIKSNQKSIAKLQMENKNLQENLTKQTEESKKLEESYSTKLKESNTLLEKYKAVANKAINKYIDSQALKLDITSNEIKNRLPQNYSFNDIDKICESLSAVKVSMNMLPFRNPAKLRENMNFEIKSPKEPLLKESYNSDDEIDDSLKTLAGM